MLLISLVIRIAAMLALFWLAIVDVRSRRLPTRAVVVVAALFFADATVIHMPLRTVVAHIGLAVGVFLFCAALFFAKMLGGGDAKLAAAIFLWVGVGLSIETLTLISMIGTVIALVSLATQRMNAEGCPRLWRWLAMFSGARGVPYGVALALGGGAVIVAPPILSFVLTR